MSEEIITTIAEDYVLPSLGKVYNKPFDPHFKIRSMTVADEMKRLAKTDQPYKMMCEIIDDCLLTKFPISSYDMCMGDYTYLLHKLRIVTYGAEYKQRIMCPKCGKFEDITYNLDDLNVNKYTDDIEKDKIVELPETKDVIKLRFQTPRDLDRISEKAKEMKEDFPEMIGDPTILLTVESFIDSINNEPVNRLLLIEKLKSLPMKDMNLLAQKATKLNEKVGIDTIINVHCDKCNNDVKVPFLFNSEFFGPTVD